MSESGGVRSRISALGVNTMTIGRVGAVLGVVVLAGYVTVCVRQVAEAGCFIGWDVNDTTTCEVAQWTGYFTFELDTEYYSQNKGTWVLKQQSRDIGTDGLINPDNDEGSNTIYESGGTASGVIETTCDGYLDGTEASEGTFQLNSWDETGNQCSGAWEVTVKPDGEEC